MEQLPQNKKTKFMYSVISFLFLLHGTIVQSLHCQEFNRAGYCDFFNEQSIQDSIQIHATKESLKCITWLMKLSQLRQLFDTDIYIPLYLSH